MKAAVDVVEQATAALEAATSAETGAADTPVEAKSGGKAKKGVASASLGTSGEEVTWPPRIFRLAVRGKSPIVDTLEARSPINNTIRVGNRECVCGGGAISCS